MGGSADRKPEDATVSLNQLLDECLANPYPLGVGLREQAHGEWERYLHRWRVTGYEDGVTVGETLLRRYPTIELLPGTLTWRQNLGLRGLEHLPVCAA
jgi:hypothetical protein